VPREAVLSRVRGRIDAFGTETKRLLDSGRVACRFEEMTSDTPRNRYIRAALDHLTGAGLPAELRTRCLALSGELGLAGVGSARVSPRWLAREQFGRNDAEDRLMLEAARLAFEFALPSEEAGQRRLARAERSEVWLRHLFERAVGGFYRAHLPASDGWRVSPSRSLDWGGEDETGGMGLLLPGMITNITIDRGGSRLVIDTKFTDAYQSNRWGREVFKSAHLYQLYDYLRSQEGRGCQKDDGASGMLLYPTVEDPVDEAVTLHGHRIRFATIDLTATPPAISDRLLGLAREALTSRMAEAGHRDQPP
jgi:5-methylcytosine-specific restriction enzyme subunit McrC